MSDAAVTTKIAELKRVLSESDDAAGGVSAEPDKRIQRLKVLVETGFRHIERFEDSFRASVGKEILSADAFPAQLTMRSRRLLGRSREFLGRLRAMADMDVDDTDVCGNYLPRLYREAVAMVDVALRMVQAFPDAAGAQNCLCEGLEAIVNVVAERVEFLDVLRQRRLRDTLRVETLVDRLLSVSSGHVLEIKPFVNLAESLLEDAEAGEPIRFYEIHFPHQESSADGQDLYQTCDANLTPARFIAYRSLVTAQVLARICRHDQGWRNRLLEPLLAALFYDVGMLQIPAEILFHPGHLNDEQRRVIERHVHCGVETMTRLNSNLDEIIAAIAAHHERLDGAGYPGGLRDKQISSLARLLTIADVYGALCVCRPYRPARDKRAALTDTMLLAEEGALDAKLVERLFTLSFFPVGSLVELGDGTIGVVVANHTSRRDSMTPTKPVIAILTDAQGQALPLPRHVDLNESEGLSISRTLSSEERGEWLRSRRPEFSEEAFC